MQLQNLTQISPVKCKSKRINTNSESGILIESPQDTICILKKKLIYKENIIKNLSIILKNVMSDKYKVSYPNKECANEPILENNTDHIDIEVITPLNKVHSCEEQLTEIRKKCPNKYITFTNNKQLLSDHPFPKGTCLLPGDSMLAGIDENRLTTGKHKVKVTYSPGACTDGMYDYMKPLLSKLPD